MPATCAATAPRSRPSFKPIRGVDADRRRQLRPCADRRLLASTRKRPRRRPIPTGSSLPSNRLPFQPDWTFNLNSDYVVPIGKWRPQLLRRGFVQGQPHRREHQRDPGAGAQELCPGQFRADLQHRRDRSRRVRRTISSTPNITNSFIEKTTLENVFGPGPLASDLGIMGDKRRYGVRTRFRF